MVQMESTPKIFISYSWASSELVLGLAERLMAHGVNVVLDKWELKEGQDKYAFMEQCVNDPEISKVLIICDKTYSEKANNRTGGVGDETVIISSEIYGNSKQEKFIPVVVEKNEQNEGYVPIYIKSRIYIDLSNEMTFESEYEKLLRNIYDKPLYVKPKLGNKPEWLETETISYFPLKDILSQIRGNTNKNRRMSCILNFQTTYIDMLKQFYEVGATPKRNHELFLNTKVMRDYFLEFVEIIAEFDEEYANVISDFFETMYNQLTNKRTFEPNAYSGNHTECDVFKNLIHELFICTVVFMRHIQDYASINTILTHTYFLETSIFGGEIKPNNYTAFRFHNRTIESEYKPTTNMKNHFTLFGEVICNQREKLPIYSKEAIAETDLFLYQVCNAFELSKDERDRIDPCWFPNLYIYANKSPEEWLKMKSRKYCEKMMTLFGVRTINELKNVISKCTDNREIGYHGSFNYAPSILNCIAVDDIAKLN